MAAVSFAICNYGKNDFVLQTDSRAGNILYIPTFANIQTFKVLVFSIQAQYLRILEFHLFK